MNSYMLLKFNVVNKLQCVKTYYKYVNIHPTKQNPPGKNKNDGQATDA